MSNTFASHIVKLCILYIVCSGSHCRLLWPGTAHLDRKRTCDLCEGISTIFLHVIYLKLMITKGENNVNVTILLPMMELCLRIYNI